MGLTANLQGRILFPFAKRALKHARPRISGFSVGAAGIARSRLGLPRIIVGYNNEPDNADSLHGEESLVAKLKGKQELRRVVILAGPDLPVAPCGNCREVLAANSKPTTEVLVQLESGERVWKPIAKLLPSAFQEKDNDLSLRDEEVDMRLFEVAKEKIEGAYNPYVGRARAAALITQSGQIFPASGRQDAAYHHEHSVEVVLNVADANRARDLRALLFLHDKDEPLFPCGRCCQKILEASQVAGEDDKIRVISASTGGKFWYSTIGRLLPHSFGPNNLKIDVSRFL